MTSHARQALLPIPFVTITIALAIAATLSQAHAQEQTARLIKDANRTPTNLPAGISWVLPTGQGVVFPVNTLAHGAELWTSTGTPGSTRLLKDFTPGPGSSYPGNPVAFGADAGASTGTSAKVAMMVDRWPTSDELWVTDGTEAGTQQVFQSQLPGYAGQTTIRAGTTGGFFFEDNDGSLPDALELHFSDGTPAGTRVLNPLVGESHERFSNPSGYITSGTWCYFIANENEIWRSDGSEAGTTKVITIPGEETWLESLALSGGRLFIAIGFASNARELWTCPMDGGDLTQVGPPDETTWTGLNSLTPVGDGLFFIAGDEEGARRLWTTDGTAVGTRRIPLVDPGAESEPEASGPLTPWKDAVYFSAGHTENHRQLWRSDGTPGDTSRLTALPEGVTYLWPYAWQENADALYFFVDTFEGQQVLWRTRGDAASTGPVRGVPRGYPLASSGAIIATTSSAVFFASEQTTTESAMWRLRGKAAGAVRLTRPDKTNGSGIPNNYAPPYELLDGSLLEFVETNRRQELWRMTPDGKRSRAIWKTPQPLGPSGQLAFHGITPGGAIFSYYGGDGIPLRQVWVTDGTKRGTRLLGDHGAGKDDGYPIDFVIVGGTCYYTVLDDNPYQSSLWKTDGTPAGTSKIVDANGNAPSPDSHELVAFDGGVAFLSTNEAWKTSLWLSDGTAAGTVHVKDTWYGPNNWYGQTGRDALRLSVVGGKLYFAANQPKSQVLWQSDGSTAGTVEVIPATAFSAGSMSPAIDLNGVAIFHARRSGESHIQWWRHSGSDTTPVRDPVAGQQLYGFDQGPARYAVVGDKLFYTGIEDDDSELWVTDGTAAGTHRVKDIFPGFLSSMPAEMLAVGDMLYFTAWDPAHGNELWRSDGTEAGTVLVADIEPGPTESYPYGLKVMDGKLYFRAHRLATGRELYSIDLPME